MGSTSSDPGAYADEMPQHSVFLDDFWIDQTEVTNAMYQMCVRAGICYPPASAASNNRTNYYTEPALSSYPVINVDWYQAKAYCQWAGRRLPSEAEWEKAARGTRAWTYPWGIHAPDEHWANFNEGDAFEIDDPFAVGSYPSGASPYGVLDMAGNVWEWVKDWYSGTYYRISPAANPPGPRKGEGKVLRGGSWSDGWIFARTTVRDWSDPAEYSSSWGFRCVRSE